MKCLLNLGDLTWPGTDIWGTKRRLLEIKNIVIYTKVSDQIKWTL